MGWIVLGAVQRADEAQLVAHEKRMEFADSMKAQLRERQVQREDMKEVTFLEGEQMVRRR